jgi:hypothetical protein
LISSAGDWSAFETAAGVEEVIVFAMALMEDSALEPLAGCEVLGRLGSGEVGGEIVLVSDAMLKIERTWLSFGRETRSTFAFLNTRSD